MTGRRTDFPSDQTTNQKTNIMHKLISSILSKSSVKEWRKHIAAAREFADQLRPYEMALLDYSAEVQSARDEFYKKPSAATRDAWLDAEARRAATHALQQDLHREIESRFSQAIKDGGEKKLIAACEEVRAELKKQEAEILAEDAKRTEEVGEKIVSTARLRVLEREFAQLSEIIFWAHSDLTASAHKLISYLGSN